MNPSLKSLVRRATQDDVQAITDIYNDAILNTTATFDTKPKSSADRLEWFLSHDDRHPVLVLEVNRKIVGWASLTQWSDRKAYDSTVETTFYVDSESRGRGYGWMLGEALVDEARELGFHTLIARITDGSDASIHLHERAGFEHIGTMKEVGHKFGDYLDVHILQKIL